MTIDFTVEEYFEQLKLMEDQYGQEEDLYPWIYMLLQSSNVESDPQLSIRDVHKHGFYTTKESINTEDEEEQNTKWEIRYQLSRGVGHPEFVVFGQNNKIVGVVEVKKLDINKKLIGENLIGKEIDIQPIDKNCQLKFSTRQRKDKEKIYEEMVTELKKMYSKEIRQIDNVKRIVCLNSEEYEKKILENFTVLRPIPSWEYEKKIDTKDYNQLLGHIDKFTNVLYTNGLEFYFFQKQSKSKVKCMALVDLTEEYKGWCDKRSLTKEEKNKWNDVLKVIENFKHIDSNKGC